MVTETPFFITTAIDYVNGPPHLGHAYEKIATDVMARWQRLVGRPTFFLTGTDEHGIKIEKNARERGVEPRAFTDEVSTLFKATWELCQVGYDRFIRTTEPAHYVVVEMLWRKLLDAGAIYKASYEGKYCSGCEAFLSERDLTEDGLCLIHGWAPELVEEENYFFRLSAFKERLIEHIEQTPGFIQPEFRRQEVLRLLADVVDISVSRSRSSVSWGIPVPDDPEQVIYVWIDALSNYLTGVGYLDDEAQYRRFWCGDTDSEPNAVHVIGKDILRFHAIYWPAMLMAAELPLPKMIFAHGFITLNESKISKSLGNVVAPQDLVSHFELPHSDPIRYYLMTVVPFGSDGNFSTEDFKLRVNADLSNNLGNLLNRSLSMLKKYEGGVVPEVDEGQLEAFAELLELDGWVQEIAEAYEAFAFHKASELILRKVDQANLLINKEEPWNLKKEGKDERLRALLYALLETLRRVALVLSPITPQLSAGIWRQLGLGEFSPLGRTLAERLALGLSAGLPTQPSGPLLPRLDSELVGAAGKK